ncbi:nuclear transport factor 2 family protein [Microvirga brassicacearum]|uniref:Nuclear transport factor 2 family protein n=1 Tax=Microvirga brassicacearum TaxID=2580413 RepID=A0A5N3P532_9HYPH|nr:nuclear transport factor 2 family protein [Microvirga brassicacearum]KAB0264813.1 nuclear transport factor 2 family protein [Microvirga brassicacearum]
MDAAIKAFFERYEAFMNRALAGPVDVRDCAAFFASDFIAATPAGIMGGKNDDSLVAAMEQGYRHYRDIGTKEMEIADIRLMPIDERHVLANVDWKAVYRRTDAPDLTIDFVVHYLVRHGQEQPKIFGWIAGDEDALLRKHGIG